MCVCVCVCVCERERERERDERGILNEESVILIVRNKLFTRML